jgi:putative colanic acid biosynthesis UDP-glucose lipid carrier transferase
MVVGLWAALQVPHERQELILSAAAALTAFLLLAEVVGLYRNWLGTPIQRELFTAVLVWVGTAGLLATAVLLSGYEMTLTRPELLRWLVLELSGLLGVRVVFRGLQQVLRANGIGTRNYAIVGINELGFELARNIDQSPDLGLKFVGMYDDRLKDRLPTIPAEFGAQVGNIDELVKLAHSGQIEQIYITFPMRAEERINRVLNRLSDTTASVYVVPDFFVFELLHSRWTQIGNLPAVSVFENPFYGVDGLVKRVLDVVIGSALLLALAIPMLLIALAVKITSRGPIIFRQNRYGQDGREIRVWKFRSMRVTENGGKIQQATLNDPRITRLGAFLRRTSLDELPQLINVIMGSMSLVGPRPHATAHNEQYRKLIPGYMLRHKVKPGITGLAQVNGWRGETDTDEKMQKRVEFDHKYIREWSPWLDIKILFKTVFTVLKGNNAR